ncbi:MAG: outer membrane beta-barrel protein [Acidobacteriota bacterium]
MVIRSAQRAWGICFVAVIALACATMSSAADIRPFLKLGIDTNGDIYSDLDLGFGSRLTYGGGVDFVINKLISVGPEFRAKGYTADYSLAGAEYEFKEREYEFLGNFSVAPQLDASIAPYFGAGMGLVHLTAEYDETIITDPPYPVFRESDSADKGVFRAFGGVRFTENVFVEFEVRHIFMDDAGTDAIASFGVRF